MIQDINRLFISFERDFKLQPTVNIEDDTLKTGILPTSPIAKDTTEVFLVAHVEDSLYHIFRVIPEYQSRNERMQEAMKNPHRQDKPSQKKFKYLKYQTKTEPVPNLSTSRENAAYVIQQQVNWNQNASRLKRAMSGEALSRAWMDYIK